MPTRSWAAGERCHVGFAIGSAPGRPRARARQSRNHRTALGSSHARCRAHDPGHRPDGRAMLTQILVAVLVVSVAVMVARDLARTKTEGPLGQPDGSGYELRPRIAGDRHGDHTGTSARDRYGRGASPAGYDTGPGR